MQVLVTFRHIEATDALRRYAESKVDRIHKFAHRPIEAHVSLGFGQHFGLGASLARLEARVLFHELLARRPRWELAGPVERTRSSFVNGIERMPVVFR